eukprot:m.223922 g.223922  ORF g.223922 m.223922 type:complete len:269 (+) comp26354_c0_seq5:121-927(+)
MMLWFVLLPALVSSLGCHSDMDCLAGTDIICSASTTGEGLNCTLDSNGNETKCVCSPPPSCETIPAVINSSAPQYLMIGDSISFGMRGYVFQNLSKHGFESVHNPTNAANVNWGLHCINNSESWLGSNPNRWDVISFNFGLHDLAKDNNGLSLEIYTSYLSKIIDILTTQTRAKLLWVTTTPVPNVPLHPPRLPADVPKYNQAATTALATSSKSIAVTDLYSWVTKRCGVIYKTCDIQKVDNPHYTDFGWQYLAVNVTNAVLKTFHSK